MAILILGCLSFTILAFDIGDTAPEFKLLDSKGNEHNLSDYNGKYIVLEWSHYGCPFVKKHYNSGNMQKLQEKYKSKGVVWLTICSTFGTKASNVEANNKKYKNASTAYLLDNDGKVGLLFKARTTPHVFILDKQRKLLYKGAVDSIASANVEDIIKATNYIETVLDAAQTGKPISKASTKPYGCGIKYKR